MHDLEAYIRKSSGGLERKEPVADSINPEVLMIRELRLEKFQQSFATVVTAGGLLSYHVDTGVEMVVG